MMILSLPLLLSQKVIPLEDRYSFVIIQSQIYSLKGNSPCKQTFPDIGTRRRVLDHYLKGICKITSYYRMFTNEVLPSQTNQTQHQIQTDDIDLDFSKLLKQIFNIKNHKEQIQFL